MENRIKLLLLKYLQNGKDIANLERAGYSFSLIAQEYSKIINDNLIILDDKLQFVLSEKGVQELERLTVEVRKKGKILIEPYVNFKTKKLDKYDIYIE